MSEMFNVKHNECVGFESRWKVTKVSYEIGSQTTEFAINDATTITAETTETGVQSEISGEPSAPNVDMDRLAEWLKSIYPKVKDELDDAVYSKVFQGYRLIGDSSDVSCKVLQTIDVHSNIQELRVSCVTWDPTGKVLAVSCNYDHNNEWCLHTGTVQLYTLNRDGLLNSTADKMFEVESCVTYLCFHPRQQNIIGIGTYSGTLILLNTDYQEADYILVQMEAHDDTVTQLAWISDINSPRTFLVATSSLDGFLNLWKPHLSDSSMKVVQKYKMKSPLFKNPKIDDSSGFKRSMFKSRMSESPDMDVVIRGVTCFDFSKHVPDMFVVGLEGGLVAQCSMLGASKLKGSTDDIPISDPIFMYHESHLGELMSVKFSPNNREMFMTCASDDEIRIYIVGQEEPARIIFLKTTLLLASWVPYEEKLVAGCGVAGIVEVFDIIAGNAVENLIYDKVSEQILTHMEMNPSSNTKVAVGNDKGQVHLWKIPWNGITSSITN